MLLTGNWRMFRLHRTRSRGTIQIPPNPTAALCRFLFTNCGVHYGLRLGTSWLLSLVYIFCMVSGEIVAFLELRVYYYACFLNGFSFCFWSRAGLLLLSPGLRVVLLCYCAIWSSKHYRRH